MEDWALKYRPQTFSEVVGQKVNTKILESTLDDPYHTMIFQGSSGCGKTTSARIYGNMLKAHMIEVDAASNNSVDDIRRILELVRLAPLSNKYRVVIVDECHMLTPNAWNAALKAIEEPNSSTIWIFCTTEFKKVPDTIKGRAVTFKFYPLGHDTIVNYLKEILAKEGETLNDTVLTLIASNCKGQVRDALKMCQRCAYTGVETEDQFNKLFGIPDTAGMRAYIESVLGGDVPLGLQVINKLTSNVDFFDWKCRLEGLIQDIMFAVFGIDNLRVKSPSQADKLLSLAQNYSPRLFGLFLDKLARIVDSNDARTRLVTLILMGVE